MLKVDNECEEINVQMCFLKETLLYNVFWSKYFFIIFSSGRVQEGEGGGSITVFLFLRTRMNQPENTSVTAVWESLFCINY